MRITSLLFNVSSLVVLNGKFFVGGHVLQKEEDDKSDTFNMANMDGGLKKQIPKKRAGMTANYQTIFHVHKTDTCISNGSFPNTYWYM